MDPAQGRARPGAGETIGTQTGAHHRAVSVSVPVALALQMKLEQIQYFSQIDKFHTSPKLGLVENVEHFFIFQEIDKLFFDLTCQICRKCIF